MLRTFVLRVEDDFASWDKFSISMLGVHMAPGFSFL